MQTFLEAVVQNPVKVAVGVLLVALFGIVAVLRMPMQLTPEVQTPTLTIETRWPGASPQEVEREIVQEQEKQLKSVEGVTKMTSESMDSLGRITLEFPVGTDMREALLKANTRLQQVREYPEDADEPIINTANLSDRPIAWFILSPLSPSAAEYAEFEQRYPHLRPVLEKVKRAANEGVAIYRLRELAAKHPELKELLPPDIDITTLRKFAEDVIEARFERVEGVSDSQVMGGRMDEMQVIVDPHKLAARQLTVMDLRNALRGQNKDTSAGDVYQGTHRYVVRTRGQYRSPKEVADTIIAYQDNAPVYVRDVAEVQLGHRKPDGFVRRFGTQRLAINAIRETGANVLEVMAGLRAAAKELNEGVLKQKRLHLAQVYDETEYIYASIGLVQDNIIVGGILTTLVLLIFLRSFRSTLVIFLAIPTSIVGTFLLMFIMGRSLNVISLAGMAFAVGMLVDNSVVVLENIYRHYQQGAHPFTAAVRGTKEVWSAVLSSTLTTLAVFVPVIFVQEEAGQLFRDIALAISAGISLSLIVSLTVIPPAAARLLRADRAEHAPDAVRREGLLGRGVVFAEAVVGTVLYPFTLLGRGFVRILVDVNARLQKSVLLRLAVVVGFVVLSFGLSYLLMPKIEYLPTGNRNLVISILLPPPGYNLDKMTALGEKIEQELRPFWDEDGDTVIADGKEYPAIGDYFYVVRGRQIFMGVRSRDPQRSAELVPLIRKVGSRIPGTFLVARQSSLFEQGLGTGRTIDVEITGPQLEKLIALGTEVMGKVYAIIPDVQALPKPSLDLASPEVHVDPKREQAAQLKMTAQDIGYTVAALTDGAYATDYFFGADKIDLRILGKDPFPIKDRDSPYYRNTQDIGDLPIATPVSTQPVPLRAIATVKVGSGPEQVNHRERQRAITISVSPPAAMPIEEAMDRIQEQIITPMRNEGKLENGLYQINLEGTADKLSEMRRTFTGTWTGWNFDSLVSVSTSQVVLVVLITYLLMAALFESWVYPFVVILSVPLGAVGGFLALWLLNLFVLQPLDVLTMLGFVILVGTVVNNPILIVEQALIHMREEKMPMREAILESVRNRIRPIFMTTTTTLFGLLPLVLFPGAGSELYRGLGAVMLGGLLVSTLVTLVVIPAVLGLAIEFMYFLTGKMPGMEVKITDDQPAAAHVPAAHAAPDVNGGPAGGPALVGAADSPNGEPAPPKQGEKRKEFPWIS